jgi:hypothetical protein
MIVATKADPFLVCKASFHSPAGFIAAGDIYEADHPVVEQYPERFEPLKVHRVERPAIEQATAAPGEKRGRR